MVYFESQIIRPSVSASPSKCLDGHGGTFTLVSRCVAEHTHLGYFLLLLQSIIGWELVQKWSSSRNGAAGMGLVPLQNAGGTAVPASAWMFSEVLSCCHLQPPICGFLWRTQVSNARWWCNGNDVPCEQFSSLFLDLIERQSDRRVPACWFTPSVASVAGAGPQPRREPGIPSVSLTWWQLEMICCFPKCSNRKPDWK